MGDEEIIEVVEPEGPSIVVVTPVTDNLEFITIDNGTVGPRGPAGPEGPRGPAGLDVGEVAYTHIQSVASDRWVINHPLNFTPNVTAVDSAGAEQVGTLTYASSGTIILEFGAAFSGAAYLS